MYRYLKVSELLRAVGVLRPPRMRPFSFSRGGRVARWPNKLKDKLADKISAHDGEFDDDVSYDEDLDDEIKDLHIKLMASRARRERKDSVTTTILQERLHHLKRISQTDLNVLSDDLTNIRSMGLGQKKKKYLVYTHHGNAGAGGHAQHIGSAREKFPVFKHVLPEVVLAGHTNSGKSTLVNALAGIHPRTGPAGVSDRAGWTDLICFYQLGKEPPVLNLVDLPGYGHAVASTRAQRDWAEMIKSYLTDRHVISRCCVLVDCCRGFCAGDRALIRLLHKNGIQVQVVLTKGDLLRPDLLARAIVAVRSDLIQLLDQIEAECRQNKKASNDVATSWAARRELLEKETPRVQLRETASAQLENLKLEENDVVSEKDVTISTSNKNIVLVEDIEGGSDEDLATDAQIEQIIDDVDWELLHDNDGLEEGDCVMSEDELLAMLEKEKETPSESEREIDAPSVAEVEQIGTSTETEEMVLKSAQELERKPNINRKVLNKKRKFTRTDPRLINFSPLAKTADGWPTRLPLSHLVVAVSASTGAGITNLWGQLRECADATVRTTTANGHVLPENAVLEHLNANLLRKSVAAKQLRLKVGIMNGGLIKKSARRMN